MKNAREIELALENIQSTRSDENLKNLNAHLFLHGMQATYVPNGQRPLLVVFDFGLAASFYGRTLLMHQADAFATVESCGSRWRLVKNRFNSRDMCFPTPEAILNNLARAAYENQAW